MDEEMLPESTWPESVDELPPTTMIGRSPYGAALGQRPDPEKGRDALGRTTSWSGHSGEPPQGDRDVMFPGELELGKPDPAEWAGDLPERTEVMENGLTVAYVDPPKEDRCEVNVVPNSPSTLYLAEELLREAMGGHAQRMQEVIDVMTPADRDHILASLKRAHGMLAKKIMEDW